MKRLLPVVIGLILCTNLYSQTPITVNPSTTYQTIRGFGGAGQMTSGYDQYLKHIVDLMGITAFRIFIEDGESSSSIITAAQINSGTFNFTFATNYGDFHKALKAKGVTTIIANCGSPAASLKDNLSVNGGGSLLSQYYDEDGKYKAAWVKDFETKTGQIIYGFGIQNEPLFPESYPSGILTAQNYGASLQAIRTEFTNAGLSHVKFYGPEHMGSYGRNAGGDGASSKYIQNLLWNATYRPLLDIYACHSYTDGIAADLGSAPGWTSLDTAVRKWNKDLWMTETEFGGTCDWTMFMNMTRSLYAALKYGKVNAWLYWGLNGNNGMYVSGSATPRLYACMHFFRFIRPGYQQIQCTEGDADIAAVAFNKDNDYTIVAVNLNATKAKTITLNSFTGKPAYFDMYRSMARNSNDIERCAYVDRITGNTFEIPANSVVTLYYKSSEPNVFWGPKCATNLAASSITDNSITVSWNAPSSWILNGTPSSTINIVGYMVYINGVKKTIDGPITKTNYTFSGLKKNTNYTIEIYARDAMFNESAAAKIILTTTCSTNDCVAIEPISINDKEAGFSVSPNPASDYISIMLPDENEYWVSIISLAGEVIKEIKTKDNQTIDISSLSKGIYIVLARDESKILKTKIAIE